MTTLMELPAPTKMRHIMNIPPQTGHLKPTPYQEPTRKFAVPQVNKPHLSYSQIKSYSACPLAWRLSRSYRPEFIPASLLFGSAFHAAAETFYLARMEGRTVRHQDLMAAYDAKWMAAVTEKDGKPPLPIQYPAKTDSPLATREMAMRMLEVFMTHASATEGEVLAVEKEFILTLADDLPPIKGRIDLVEVFADLHGRQRLGLVDFKTSAKRVKLEDMDWDQVDLYAMAVRNSALVGQPALPLSLRFEVTTKTKLPETRSLALPPDSTREKRLVAKIRQVWRGMSEGICYPTRGWGCVGCAHRSLCAKWPDVTISTPPSSASF